ncbi:alpha-1,2-fucosyltransferase [Pontibacter akesuensis]|nr:alpha-1,2-fucosyltransferase [Pontibacter akesuensis]
MNYKAGQLANRLFYFSHFISNSLAYNYKLLNPSFNDYKEFFISTASDNFNGHDISLNITDNQQLDELMRKAVNAVQKVQIDPLRKLPGFYFHEIKAFDAAPKSFDMNDPEFVASAKSKIVFIDGWLYRDFKNFEKYAPSIRQIFTPLPKYSQQVQEVMNRCRQLGDTVIGVHIRRGDYKTYNDGKWYYEDEVYFSKMQELKQQLEAQGKRCVFLICSNEKVNPESFPGMALVTEDRHFIVDLYALSQCDYLIGPPSTFTMWASFYGETPLLAIDDASQTVPLSDFKIVTKG